MNQSLLISDLHLEASRPDITRALLSLLSRFRGKITSLYILGDFFEVWLGDDVLLPVADEVASALKQFAESGASIYIMHGNRDFLLGNDYAARCNAELIPDPVVVELAGQRCLLMHGDTLCTEDRPYIEFRNMVRNPQWQTAFLAKTPAERIAFARQARTQSQSDSLSKSEEILDVTPSEVVKVMNEHKVALLIHGHTHRPGRHQLVTAMGPSERVVLGDWHSQGWFLLVNDDGLNLQSFPLDRGY